MTLKKLCSEARNLLSPSYISWGFLIVWKNGRSWSWYHIISDDWEYIKDTDEWWDEWLAEFGKDVEEEVNSFGADDNGFVYSMIGKKFDAIVEEIIIDFYNERVAVIFE